VSGQGERQDADYARLAEEDRERRIETAIGRFLTQARRDEGKRRTQRRRYDRRRKQEERGE
jgi:hypothetical protein